LKLSPDGLQNAKYSEAKWNVPPCFFLPKRQDDRFGFMTLYIRPSLDAEQFLPSEARSEPAA
jgi:hypothetical protein